MSFNVSIAGTTYSFPNENDPPGWGGNVSEWAAAISTSAKVLQISSTSFPLSTEVNFGTNYGLKLLYIKSTSVNPLSSAGVLRLARTDTIGFRNQANSGDNLLSVDTGNHLLWNGVQIDGAIGTINGTTNRITANTVGITTTIDISSSYVGQSSITTLGTVATGVWQGTKVAEGFGGTNQTTYAAGDMLYASGTNTLSKLAIGTNGYVLAISAGVPSWQPAAASSPLTTKGDIYTFSSVNARLPVGTNGYVLTADSAEATGLKWVSVAGTGTVTSVGVTVPTGFTTAGTNPVTTTGTIIINYDTGYQGYTSAEASKLAGIASGATVGATWGTNLNSIPAIISTFAALSNSAGVLSNNGSGTLSYVALPTVPTAANPSASVGLSAVNGAAATFMRSDGAPALDQGIVPTWTGAHTFTSTVTISNAVNNLIFNDSGAGTNLKVFYFNNDNGAFGLWHRDDASANFQSLISVTATGTTAGTGKITISDSTYNSGAYVYGTFESTNKVIAPNIPSLDALYVDSTQTIGLAYTTLYCDLSAGITLTLPNATAYTGKMLNIFNMAGLFAVSSASSNIVRPGWTTDARIMPAIQGWWVQLYANSTGNWVVIGEGISPNTASGVMADVGNNMNSIVTALNANYTVLPSDKYLRFAATANRTVTLPAASDFKGREIVITNSGAFTIISASSNVVAATGTSTGTGILTNISGKFARLVSNGTAWFITEYN